MRHPSKRKRTRPHGTPRTPSRKRVIVPREPTNTRMYRGPAGSVVVWNRGRFIVKTVGGDRAAHGYARLPKGLETRVIKAIEKGRVDVWVTN